jgi:drug/metabolite transporter (DMT)-like permease
MAALTERWGLIPGNVRGAIWMMVSAVAFIGGQVLVKQVTPGIPVAEVTFFRCAITFLLAAPLVLRGGRAAFVTQRFHLHLLRGIAGALAMLGTFYGVSQMPLANVNIINFARPLFMIVLAALFLGETVRVHRSVATAVGFLGVLLILRPGFEAFDPAAYAVLGASACYAIAHMLLKMLTGTEEPAAIIFYYMLVAALAVLVPAAYVWVWPNFEQAMLILGIGLLTAFAQTFLTIAFRAGDATVVSPFDYTRILWAGLFDILLFAAFPDAWTIAGTLVIVCATLYIGRRSATGEPGGKSSG